MAKRIGKLLIANRAEIARRVMRSAREMGIPTVAVFSDPDEDAPFVREADEAVHLAGAAPGDTYLAIPKVIDAARLTGADAIHPGYGFLSENGEFARTCREAGLIFVGPAPEAIEAMGSKVNAKAMMVKAGVPVLPGFTIGADATSDEVLHAAERIGLPVLVKASFGGGGRGMRVVHEPHELANAVTTAQREAEAAFGDGAVFLEKYLESPRHVEVQVLGDTHGNVVSIFERECSIQRRHQKIIEEAPSPAVDAGLRAEMCEAAVAAARSVGYVGAGTVEFVLDGDGEFFFLEMNTRLQVEHPVTEMVTGLDLVRLQLEIANGEPLSKAMLETRISGHAVEARLYAEDVRAGFLPTSGRLHRFEFPVVNGIRVDSGYETGSMVSTHYDAMLAKVIAWAPSRREAATKLADALARATVHGLATNRDLLVQTLRTEEFLSGHTDTGFFERHDPAVLSQPVTPCGKRELHPIAAAVYLIVQGSRAGPQPPALPPAWRNVGGGTAPISFDLNGRHIAVAGRLEELPEGIVAGEVGPRSVVLLHDDVRREYHVEKVGMTWYIDSHRQAMTLAEVPRFPLPAARVALGSLIAPLPGTVITVTVGPGDSVDEGDVVVTIEAMKMEHAVRAPRNGRVEKVRVAPGDQVEAGDVLLEVEDGESAPVRAEA